MQTHHNFYVFRITLSISLTLDSPLLLLGLVIAEHTHDIPFYSNNLNTEYYRTYTCVAKHYKIMKFQ